MTKEQLLSKANEEMDKANSLRIKVFKFDKGELHPTIAAEYDKERRALLYKLNEYEKCAKAQFNFRIPGLHLTKDFLWRLLCSIKYRMSSL